MNTGTIKQAKQDELVKIGDRTFMRWIVAIESNGATVNSSVLRMQDSPDPTGLQAEEKPQGGWKVAQGQGSSQSNSGGKDYKADPEKLRYENKRSCLHAAIQAADKLGTEAASSADILAVASAFYEWLEGPV